ncbi:glycoside hydrolase family 2 TIM barrel-domain containing protein [Bacteroides sp. Marseille-P3684]|uniref:glycoside hydrolase family 2 TIM barrel-domain containing protein n=1 Tax=Bacteroides sp. Marseille-P3684 TaxID=2086579 RepID=UPI000D1149B3|nr:glycoside hydrolase family 2 TIM barrel-domain containing protein [Bacteroides sp. Marseille-P3684]
MNTWNLGLRKALLLIAAFCSVACQARDVRLFDEGWLFLLGDEPEMAQPGYDDSRWRQLSLPHDWAIEGDFSATNPSGVGGGALPGGVGWYRKHFRLPATEGERRYYLAFDGVYMNSTVYVNGHEVGSRPYGYSSFEYDLTPYVRRDSDNVVAVRVDNSDQPNSRWYSGCGIYRHVWLTATSPLHIARWGVHVVTDVGGTVDVELAVSGDADGQHRPVFRHTLLAPDGRTVAVTSAKSLRQKLRVRHPLRWSVDSPHLYTLKSEVLVDGEVVDAVTTRTGFREFRFDAATGFWLNGRNLKINGVCLHHDLGCLGAAVNEDAMCRQLVKLKAMGCNAIRCSHNPPAPELLDLCDEMGFIVMDESFDMWRRRKTRNDYARFFDKWHERDLSDLLLRDRNHPSVLVWSIGNEVLEQWSGVGADELTLEQANLLLNAGHDGSTLAHGEELTPNSLLTLHLAGIVRKYDRTRPVTAGCNEPSPDNHLFKSGALDLIGFNYHREWIKDVPCNFPGKPFLLTESVSALQTRGYYRMPSDSLFIAPERWDKPYTDPSMMCSSYDNQHVPWGSTHEETWDIVKHTPYCAGQFIWTGFDYLGEPTPYGFPARSSYFGIIDLAGFPKDIYYMYQSEWTDRPVLHLFPHWNWTEGQTVDLWCYYNDADEVELFVNGKSRGVRSKKDSHQYHVAWRVAYEPGEVKVVARKGGQEVRSSSIRTAGAPARIRLEVDYEGETTVFVNAYVTDEAGNLCPWAEDDLRFSVSGGTVIGVDNGSPTSMERFKADHRKAFFGKALVVIRKDKDAGPIRLEAVSPMLAAGQLVITNN